jgi:hypothetical protein
VNRNHAISDEALKSMEGALATGHPWVAYNDGAYLLGTDDILAFRTKIDAILFSAMKHEEFEEFKVIYAPSLQELFRQIPYETEFISSPNLKNMKENNLEFLKKNLLYTGFPDSLHTELEKNLKEGKPEFKLAHRFLFNDQKMDTTLHFRKGDKSDLYFFNRYEAHLYDRKDPAYDRQQTFHMTRGNEVTGKEAFNLLSGRAVNKDLVNKEGEEYNAWVQLDFSKVENNGNYAIRRFTPKWGFDLGQSLDALHVKELLSEETKANLIRSLEKGNLQAAHTEHNGKEHTIFLQANPRERTLDIFDSRMKPLDLDLIRKSPEQSADQNLSAKNEMGMSQSSENMSSKMEDQNPSKKNEMEKGQSSELGTQKMESQNSSRQNELKNGQSVEQSSSKIKDLNPASGKEIENGQSSGSEISSQKKNKPGQSQTLAAESGEVALKKKRTKQNRKGIHL